MNHEMSFGHKMNLQTLLVLLLGAELSIVLITQNAK